MSFHTHIEEACSACDDLYQELARLRAYAKYADQAGEELGRLREIQKQDMLGVLELRSELARLREDERVWTEENDRLREELITSGNDKEYQEQHWRAEVRRLREIIKQADKDRREIGKRARIAEQEETRLTIELAMLREEVKERGYEALRFSNEADRLREALEEIRDLPSVGWREDGIARNALKETAG